MATERANDEVAFPLGNVEATLSPIQEERWRNEGGAQALRKGKRKNQEDPYGDDGDITGSRSKKKLMFSLPDREFSKHGKLELGGNTEEDIKDILKNIVPISLVKGDPEPRRLVFANATEEGDMQYIITDMDESYRHLIPTREHKDRCLTGTRVTKMSLTDFQALTELRRDVSKTEKELKKWLVDKTQKTEGTGPSIVHQDAKQTRRLVEGLILSSM